MDGSNIKTDFPVVLRFDGLYPHQLGGYEAHRLRKGGDLNHVNRSRSELNQRLIGPEDWAARALAEIDEMRIENFAAELASLEKRNRKKDIERRMIEGPKQPWRSTRHGPMREVILTVNKDWFEGDAAFFGVEQTSREDEFGAHAVAWLKMNFGDDVIHARADRDEAAYHVHAVIMPRATVEIAKPRAKVPTATATRRMLQPSIHPLIQNYEAAQDSVGLWFADLGLVRGESRAAAIREARENGQKPPRRRYHAKTWKWRAEQELRLKAEAEALDADKAALDERTARVAEREEEAETVLAVAEGVASGAFVASDGEDETGLVDSKAAKPANASLEELQRRSPTGFARAAGVFGRAWERLFGHARAKAEAEADARVSSAMEQIERADTKVAEAALHLPAKTRSLIAEIRQTIPAMLRRLELSGNGLPRDSQKDQTQRDDPDDEESMDSNQ
ncbi:Plasmid recombination enzyme [Tranquillimonas rosea]|uniref:Plasmid recombination enzyme n=1 Tax=Tranquillimonas rosea TaxID=641238 RepID=A0A1H9X620_9RHOB|nr:plasmid recombination protein [Tranquillimonas rosea]SES41063.1 Plasmid recombination enzyme [Tranquillimonas rosea]